MPLSVSDKLGPYEILAPIRLVRTRIGLVVQNVKRAIPDLQKISMPRDVPWLVVGSLPDWN